MRRQGPAARGVLEEPVGHFLKQRQAQAPGAVAWQGLIAKLANPSRVSGLDAPIGTPAQAASPPCPAN